MKSLKVIGLIFLVLTVSTGCSWKRSAKKSQLNQLILPEIKQDAFYEAIYRLAKTEAIASILEIGSSSGEGSTEAFVAGARENPHHPMLFCMEVSKCRFAKLKEHYQQEPFVHCYNVSSVPLKKFPKKEEVVQFYHTISSKLNLTPLSTVLSWLEQDMDYLKNENVSQNGIELIQKENGMTFFDMVLIDGSEFTGQAELAQVYGAKWILLDDTRTFKNFHNREKLLKDPNYALVEENSELRNGYAIFKQII